MDEPETKKPETSGEELCENKVGQSEQEIHAGAKKNKESKNKKKDDRGSEVLKALSSLSTSEEKLAAMCKKYADMVEENRKLATQVKQVEKRVAVVQREKELVQTEHNKAILTRSRLENLCRELQKQNKQIKEESLQRIKEEEERRKAVSNKFQSTLGEITVLMQQNNENNSKLRDENLEMQNKFKTVCEQYELREQQVEKMSKQMKLESQLAEAKLTKLKVEMAAEKELLENDKKQLLIELAAYQHKCQELQKTEAALNSQINMYNEKYDKFQEALVKSNQLYSSFKSEIKNMSKKIAKLEKETSVWRGRWETDHQALMKVSEEKQQLTRQLNQLQKLCRTLQGDRTSLLAQLKSEGIEPKLSGNSLPCQPPGKEVNVNACSKSPISEQIVENGRKTENSEVHGDAVARKVSSEGPDDEEGTEKNAGDENEGKTEREGKKMEESERVENDEESKETTENSFNLSNNNESKDALIKTNSKSKKGKEGSKKR